MVETLDEILKAQKEEKDPKGVGEIQLFLNKSEVTTLIRMAQKKIKASAFIIGNPQKYEQDVRENAERSARIWESIATKIESQMG